MLEEIKLRLNITNEEKDQFLLGLIFSCTEDAATFCNRATTDEILTPVIIEMVVESYNHLGAEGVTSQSYSGVSESYLDDYSAKVKRMLRNRRVFKFK